MGEVLEWFLTGHDLSWTDYLINALFALLGAATCGFAINPKVQLPSRAKDELDLGFLRVLLIGTISGIAIGHKAPIPFVSGLVAPILLPVVLKKLLPTVLTALQPVAVTFLSALGGKKEDKVE